MKSLTRKCLDLTFLQLTVRCAAVLSLTCGDAEYDIDGHCCSKCPPGTRVLEDCLSSPNSTECEPCTEGTFMPLPTSRTQCYLCTTTACEGFGLKVKANCNSTSDTVCEPQDGFFCVKFKEGSCVGVNCQPGFYIKQQGSASADTVCSRCTEGTFSDGTLTQCQPHTHCSETQVIIKTGTATEDTVCGPASRHHYGLIFSVVPFLLTLLFLGMSLTRREVCGGMCCCRFCNCPAAEVQRESEAVQ